MTCNLFGFLNENVYLFCILIDFQVSPVPSTVVCSEHSAPAIAHRDRRLPAGTMSAPVAVRPGSPCICSGHSIIFQHTEAIDRHRIILILKENTAAEVLLEWVEIINIT